MSNNKNREDGFLVANVNPQEVAEFLSKSGVINKIIDAYKDRQSVQNEAQNRADDLSSSRLTGSLRALAEANAAHGRSTTFIYDKKTNSIKAIAHNDGVTFEKDKQKNAIKVVIPQLDENGNKTSKTTYLGDAKKNHELAVYNFKLPQKGKFSRGNNNGASPDSYQMVIDRTNRNNTLLMHTEDAALEETLKAINNMRTILEDENKYFENLQKAFNRGWGNLNSTSGMSREEKEQLEAAKKRGRSEEEEIVKASQVFHNAYLEYLANASKATKKELNKQQVGEIFALAQRAKSPKELIQTVKENLKISGKDDLIKRIYNDIQNTKTSVNDTTKRHINENSVLHSPGTYNTPLIGDKATETSRNQGHRGLMMTVRERNGKAIFNKSNISVPESVAKAGRHAGSEVKVGESAPGDAVVRVLGLRPSEKGVYSDVVYLNENDVKAGMFTTHTPDDHSVDEELIRKALKIKDGEAVPREFKDGDVQKIAEKYAKDKNGRKFDTKGAEIVYDYDSGKYILTLAEERSAETGTKMVDSMGLLKGSAYKDASLTERMEGTGTAIAVQLPSKDNLNKEVRKGSPINQAFYLSTFERYGNDDQGEKIKNKDLVGFLEKIQKSKNKMTSVVAGMILNNIGYDPKTGTIRPDYGALTDAIVDQGKKDPTFDTGDAYIETLHIIDRLSNGVTVDNSNGVATGTLLNESDFKKAPKYFQIKRDEEDGKRYLNYSEGKNAAEIILFTNPRMSEEYPWGETDLSRMSRTLYYDLEEARESGKITPEEYAKKKAELEHMVSQYQPSQENQTKLDTIQGNLELAHKRSNVLANTFESVKGSNDVITVGFGDNYDINLKNVEYEKYNGGTIENYDNTLRARVNAAIKERQEMGINGVQIAIDPGTGKAFALSDKNKGDVANMLYLPPEIFNAGGLLDANGDPRITEGYKELSYAAKLYNDKDSEHHDDRESFAGRMKQVLVDSISDIQNENGVVYGGLMDAKAKDSWGGKILPMQQWMFQDYGLLNGIGKGKLSGVGQEFNKEEKENYKKFLNDFMAEGGAVSADKFGEIFNEKDGKGWKVTSSQIKNALKHLMGKKGFDEWASANMPEGLKKGRGKMVEKLAKYLTLGSEENKQAIKGGKFNDYKSIANLLFGRAPFSTLDSAEILTMFIDDKLEGNAIAVGLGALAKSSSDWDGDSGSMVSVGSKDEDIANTIKKQKYAMNHGLALAKRVDMEAKNGGKGLGPDEFQLLLDKDTANESAIKQRLQKMATGPLALLRRNYSDILQKNAENGQAPTHNQMMAHTFFEAIAQDAISSKKVINNILGRRGFLKKGESVEDPMNLTPEQEEEFEKGWMEIQGLLAQRWESQGMQGVWDILGEIGLVNEDNKFAPEKVDILQSAFLKLASTESGRKYLVSSGLMTEEQVKDNIDKNGFKDSFISSGGFGELVKGVDARTMQAILEATGNEMGVDGAKGLYDLAFKKENAAKNAIYDSTQNKYAGASRIWEENAKAMEKNADSMDKFVERMDRLISLMEKNARMTGAINAQQLAKDWVTTDPRYDFGDNKAYWWASVSTALDRSWAFDGKLADENSPKHISANTKGTLGHALFEAVANNQDFNGTIATAAKEEFVNKLTAAGVKDDLIKQTIEEIEKGVREAISIKPKDRESIAAEFGVQNKTGLHGVIDEIQTGNDENGNKVLYVYDNKFTDHLPTSRYGAQLMLYKEMLNSSKNDMIAAYENESGGKWNNRNTTAVETGIGKKIIDSTADKMYEAALKAEKRSGNEIQKGSKEAELLKETATKLAEALWQTDKIVGVIRQVKSNGVVNEYKSTGMATIEMMYKILSGQELTDTEKAVMGKLELLSVHTPEGWTSAAQKAEEEKAKKEAEKSQEKADKAAKTAAAKAEADAQKELDKKFPVRSLSQLLRTGSTGMLIRKAIQYGHKAVAVTESLDQAMTNLRIVTGKTEEQAKTMMNTYGSMAKELGSTIDKVAQSAQEWLRQGYNVAETNKLVESSVYLSKLGFMDETKAVQSLTSAMKGFNLEASDSMSIVDKLTTLDAKYATTAGNLATAMSYTASVANEAGLSMDQTLAALTTIIDTTQMNSSAAGNAVKSMLSRFGNVKSGSMTALEEGEDSEGINDIERVLGAIGIQVRSTSMEMRSFSDVLDDVAESWEHLSDVERNAVATAMAGTRQRNAFVTLLGHYDTYKQAIEDQKDAEGTAEAKYATRKNSIEYLKERRIAAAQSVAESAELQNLIKLWVKFTTLLIEQANKWVPTLVTAFATYITMFSDRFKLEGNRLLEGIKALTKATNDNTRATNNANATGNPGGGDNPEGGNNDPNATRRGMKGRWLGKGLSGKEKAKNAALSGVSTGISYGMAGGGVLGNLLDEGHGVSEYENSSTNVMTGVLTGVGAAIGTAVAGPVGAMIGTLGADWLSSLIKWFTLRDAKERGDRVKAAKEQLDALTEIKSSITTSSDILKKDFASWDVSDWEKWNDAMDEMKSNIKDPKSEEAKVFRKSLAAIGIESDNASAALADLTNRTENADKVMAAYQAAMLRREAELTWAAGEEERAQIYDQLNSKKTTDNEKVHLQKQLDDMDKVREKAYMQAAFLETGYSTKNEAELYGVAVDNIILKVAERWAEDFPDIADKIFSSDGIVTKEYEATIKNYLKTQKNLESTMTGSNTSVARAKPNKSIFEDYTDEEIEKLRKLAKTRSKELEKSDLWTRFKGDDLTDDAARNLILNYDPSEMDRIANSLSMTREQLEGISDKLWWMTSGDALGGFDKLNDKLGTMSEILSDIVDDSNLTAENLKKLINQFPELVGQLNNDFSTKNIIKVMAEAVTSPEAMIAWTKSQVTRNLTDKSFWNTIKASYQGEWSKLFGKDMTDSEGRLSEANSLSEVWDLVDKSEQAKGIISSLMQTTLQTADFLNVVTDSLTEWQNKVYDDEIKNLQSIKDALGDTLKQREKELELIKAKQALENAQNEKRRVYMAGMGWTYVSDQQAVKEAQEKVDQLEREKTADDIQYQIDILEQQKDSLNEIKEAIKYENLKSLVNEVMGGSNSGYTIKGIIESIIYAKNGSKGDIDGSLDIMPMIQKSNARLDVEDKYTALASAIDTLNKASNPTEYENAKNAVDSAQSAYTAAVNNAKKTYDDYKKSDEDIYSERTGTEFDDAIGEADAKAQSRFLTGVNLFKNLPKGKYQIITDGKGRMRIKPYNGSDDKYQIYSYGDGFNLDVVDKLNLTHLYSPEEMAKLSRGFIYGISGEINFADLWGNTDELGIDKNFAGTTSFAGGRTFVNERGLEGIITPNGTLTSLPAKSGILPADLTKNLWKLGEIAPNLVAQVRGNNLVPNAVGASNDNSLNVGTLNATFNTDQSFDGEKFWSQVRSQIVLTRNNH